MIEHYNPNYNLDKLTPVKVYHPKGSMCRVCRWVSRDCSSLNFQEMKKINEYMGSDLDVKNIVVKCDEFEPEGK
jgi:hypothetical protein